jgi:hypothetical protein
VGKVTHFTFWNCDLPREYSRLDGLVKSPDGTPLAGVNIKLRSSLMGVGSCFSASTGKFSGRVPDDEQFSLELSYFTDEVKKQLTIGPFQADAVLPDIILDNLTGLVRIDGQIKGCNSVALSGGIVFVNSSTPIAVKNGTYAFFYPANLPFDVLGYDPDKGDYSAKTSYIGFSTNASLPEIVVCGGGTGQTTSYITYQIEGEPLKTLTLDYYYILPNILYLRAVSSAGIVKRELELNVDSYGSPGVYPILNKDGDYLWLGLPSDPYCAGAEEITLDVREYIANQDHHLMEMYFSGTVKVWNQQLGQFEIKNLTNGVIKSQR